MINNITLDLGPYLAADRVVFLEAGCSKSHALTQLSSRLGQCAAVNDAEAFTQAIFDRERVSSTGIGNGIAVPHAKLPCVDGFAIAVGLCPSGIEFNSTDGKPVSIVVMIAASSELRQDYLKVLASVATRCKIAEFRASLLAAEDAEAVIAVLTEQ